MMFGRLGVLASSLFVGYTLKCNCFVTFNAFVVMMLGMSPTLRIRDTRD